MMGHEECPSSLERKRSSVCGFSASGYTGGVLFSADQTEE